MPVVEKILEKVPRYPTQIKAGDIILNHFDFNLISAFIQISIIKEDNWSRDYWKSLWVKNQEIPNLIKVWWLAVSDFCMEYTRLNQQTND